MNTPSLPPRIRSAGLSLVELMVAIAIGSVLLLGLVQVFAASRAAYQTSEGLSRVQENARFAMEFLQRDIRMAGHFGCVNDREYAARSGTGGTDDIGLVQHFNPAPAAGSAFNFAVSIEGHEAPGTGPGGKLNLGAAWTAPSGNGLPVLSPAALGGSDVLVLRYLAPLGARVTAIQDARIDYEGSGYLSRDGIAPALFALDNCARVSVFPGKHDEGMVSLGGGTGLGPALRGRFLGEGGALDDGAVRLHRADSLVYYVGRNPAGQPALYRARANDVGNYVSEELVEGVESLQLLYGWDDEDVLAERFFSNITEYGTAAGARAANAWQRVGLVRVGLLMKSPDNAAAPEVAGSIRVLGTEFASGEGHDGHFRTAYETTITLRNRVLGN